MKHENSKKRLVIVESPTKARTIRRFLSDTYKVEASMGHVRDLPASATEIPAEYKGQAWARLGVKVEDGFKPLYVVSSRGKTIVNKLRSAMKDVDELFIATDEDREGESIGWHLIELLNPTVPVKRMVFHEITEAAIRAALDSTRAIDTNLVDAQETRRVLDRLVGYSISPLLWKKIAPKLSAGRVQSVAVRLLVIRERERMRFTPASYWDLRARLQREARGERMGGNAFEAVLTHLDDVRVASGRDFDADSGRLKDGLVAGRDVLLLARERAEALALAAQGGPWSVDGVEERQTTRTPAAPFTTSTLQQEASRKLGLAAKETMRVAQELYENGYITYMRTDSINLSTEAIAASRAAIERRYGKDYLHPSVRAFKGPARNAQEAHEAIRPAGKDMKTGEELGLGGIQGALYDLIWKRTVATQMADARLKFVTARIASRTAAGNALFRATGRTVLFPGFFRAYVEGSDDPEAALDDRDQPLPELAEGDELTAHAVNAEGHETKPPARYTEASLVKLLESEGIGRPSTYASILDTIMRRGYVRKNGTQLVPTFVAFATNNLLEHQFRNLVDTEFTAKMETALDDIATGNLAAKPYLTDFFLGPDGIEARVTAGLEGIDARSISTIENERWDPYVVRVGRYGPYVEGPVEGGELKTTSLPDAVAPGDLTRDMLAAYLEDGNAGDVDLGPFPATGQAMLLKRGPYGPYLQLGNGEADTASRPSGRDGSDAEATAKGGGGKGTAPGAAKGRSKGGTSAKSKGKGKPKKAPKPKRVSLPPGLDPHEVDASMAAALLSLPKEIGSHPETSAPVRIGIGPYGPYVLHEGVYASIPKGRDVFGVTLEEGVELLNKKAARNKALRNLGKHPETGVAIEVRDGRYGPYVKAGKRNASLPKDLAVDDVTLEQAVELLRARDEQTGKGARKAAKAAPKGRAKAASKGRAKKGTKAAAKKKPAAPKATTADLAPFLTELEPQVADVVRRVEGMAGHRAAPKADVAQALDIDADEVARLHKKGMFKLRMAFGKQRSETLHGA